MAPKKSKVSKGATPAKSDDNRKTQTKATKATTPTVKVDPDLLRFWMDMQQDMGKQIAQLMEKQQKFYQDFNDRWMKISSEMNETMSKATMDNDKLDDIQRSWERNQQKMNQRLENIMKTENEAFEALNTKWKALSEDMGKAVVSLGNVTDMRKAQERFLMTWTEMSREMTRQMARSLEMGTGEFKVLRDTWLEVVEDMDRHARDIVEKDPHLQETFKGWTENTKDLSKELMDHMDNTSEDVTKLQNMWTHSLSNVTSEFVKSVWDMNMKWLEETSKTAMKGK